MSFVKHNILLLYLSWGVIGLDKLRDYRLYEGKTANLKIYDFIQSFYGIGMRQ